MTRKRTTRQGSPPPLTHLIFLASTATAVSLANFQLITDPAVPLGCIVVYNQQFFGCTNADFAGRGCSNQCREGVLSTQSTLQRVCGFIDQPPNSFLGSALRGQLVTRICPVVPASSTAQQQTRIQTTITSARPGTQAPTTTPRGQTPSTTIGNIRPTTSANRGITSTIGEQPTSSVIQQPLPEPTTVPEPTTEPAPDQQASPAIDNTRLPTSAGGPAAETPDPQPGGGSPFDNAVRESAAMGNARWSQGLILATVLGYLFVW